MQDDAFRYDFFQTEEGIRIKGQGQMPIGSLSDSYEDRKAKCIEIAQMQANSKWLALTETTIELQTLWLNRLSKGAKGPWQKCLDDAKIERYLPEENGCAVVMLYRCDPRNW
ncbi:MAG: hypothetical protein H3C43_02630 [Leptonema sp. (in: Bacteria)]|nr:hypothetical protein [Leptonema sp. (in: bacteria)]